MGILEKIVKIPFPSNQYNQEVFDKTQIVLHHTVSGEGIMGDINHWIKTKSRIATCIIISRDGTANQLFSSQFWGYHLGIKKRTFIANGLRYRRLDKTSIGVEIDSSGGLTKKDNKWYDTYGHLISNDRVVEYPKKYRGYYAYEKYTSNQIETLKELLLFWRNRYGIPLMYNADMFEVSKRALRGVNGVWSHTSFRKDKSDIHPQEELINMLKRLQCG